MKNRINNTPLPVAYTTQLPIRIGDINYGGHLGSIEIQGLMHDVRLQYFATLNLSEKNFGEGQLILQKLWVHHYKECHYGDTLTFKLSITNLKKVRFDMFYAVTTIDEILVAEASMTFATQNDVGRPIKLPETFIASVSMP